MTSMKRLLGLTRYAVVVPALASIIGALLLMAQGSFAMVLAVIDSIQSQYGLKETIVEVLNISDRLKKINNSLLLLAKIENKQFLEQKNISLRCLVKRAYKIGEKENILITDANNYQMAA